MNERVGYWQKKKEDYEISDFSPAWLDANFPNKSEYMAVMDIVKFYLINSPCENSSSRGTDISRWGNPSIVLLDRLKAAIGLERGTNYDYGKSRPEMKQLFDKYGLKTDFTNKTANTIVFLNDLQVFEKIFKHIRNSIAHSRWQVKNDIYYFEDGSEESIDGEQVFCVAARIILNKESLLKWRDIILAGPSEAEKQKIHMTETLDKLLKELRSTFGTKPFKRKEAIDSLRISNDLWKKLYIKGKKDGVMKFSKSSWEIKKIK